VRGLSRRAPAAGAGAYNPIMSTPSPVHLQLESLRIPREQRPIERALYRPKRRWPKVLAGLVLIGGGGAAALYFGGKSRLSDAVQTLAPAAEVRTLVVTPRVNPARQPLLTATGKIVSDHRVAVATKVSGQIEELFFEQGDRVTRGQLLARIEETNYRARRDQAKAMLDKARANVVYQEFNFGRLDELYKRGVAKEFERVEAKRLLDEARAQVAAEEAALEWSQKALDDCRVAAPIAGVVLERNVEVGDFVAAEAGRGAQANAQVAVIADMAKLRVEVDISELAITRLRKDMPCEITPDAYKDRRYKGRVMWLDPAANYSKATVQVKVRIDAPDEFLRVEGSAQVVFLPEPSATRSATDEGIWIPASAVTTDGADRGRVFLVVDGRLKQRTIRLGPPRGDQVQAIEGLRAGDVIVADRVAELRENQKVRAAP